jgi:predicted nuclease of predicted toxin-antitoxin system
LTKTFRQAYREDSPTSIQKASIVREVDLRDATDLAIWEYAKVEGYAIVSKDSDFQQRSLLYGGPPKFIWLRVGNCPVSRIESILRTHSAVIHTFQLDDFKSHLMLP